MQYSAYIVGGIGDVILGLQGFREISELFQDEEHILKCYLCTHAEEAYSLVKDNPYVKRTKVIKFTHDLETHRVELFNLISADKHCMKNALDYCTTYYPEIFLKNPAPVIGKPKVILHPGGSAFSRYYLTKERKVPPKEMDAALWQKMITGIDEDKYEIIAIGSDKDSDYINELGLGKYNRAGLYSLKDSINLIKHASMVIAVDSFAKSVSLACKIPTVVFVNSCEDPYRDATFLTPYKDNKHAKIVWNANDLTAEQIKEIVLWRDEAMDDWG